MKLDILCELDLLRSEKEVAESIPYTLIYADDIQNAISSIQVTRNKIDNMRGLPQCLPTRLYYGIQANILETNNPDKVMRLYEDRIKDIAGFEFCEDNLECDDLNEITSDDYIDILNNETEEDEKQYDEDISRAFIKLRRLCDGGTISEDQRKTIKKTLFDIAHLWADLLWWIWEDMQSIKGGENKRPQNRQQKRTCNKELNKKEIDGLERLLKNQGKIQFVKKEGDKYIWIHSVQETSLAFFVNSLYPSRARWVGVENYFGMANLRTTSYLPKNGDIKEDENDWRHAMTIALRAS